ncbi:MAG: biotin--[Alistipes sp.]|nr:biotin--[acetyl-CoA-carboxylase] ligase [Alistipes sp.]
MIYHLDITTSTNDDARDEKYREGDVVWADFQTAGRGQRGHIWHSKRGENLTFSVVLEPTFLPIAEQFSVSEVVALSLVDMLSEYGIGARIKWTNDIYVGDKKLVGILIEHSLAPTTLRRTIAGIGININQTEFDASLPNPVSMAQLLGRELDAAAGCFSCRRYR